MGNPALEALAFFLGTLFNLYAIVVAVRFVMQVVRASYNNQLARGVVKITDPLLVPLRRVVRSIKCYDTASLLLCFGILILKLAIFKSLGLGAAPSMGKHIFVSQLSVAGLFIVAFLDMVHLFFNVFIYALIIQAVMSWIPSSTANPIYGVVSSISAPVLRPLRNRIPPIGGIDLTVFFTILVLLTLQIFVVETLQTILGLG